jgi:hypothetical protein
MLLWFCGFVVLWFCGFIVLFWVDAAPPGFIPLYTAAVSTGTAGIPISLEEKVR